MNRPISLVLSGLALILTLLSTLKHGFTGDSIYFNNRDFTTRAGKAVTLAKPTGVRLRLKNDSDGINNFWLTIAPATPVQFLPFGFGETLKTIAIRPNIGTGGPINERGFAYLRALIPAGKWSVSLGAKSEDNCSVDLNSYDARGVDYPSSIFITGVGQNEGQEKIITLLKPTTLLFRVLNDNTNAATYGLTIEKSTD